MAGLGWTARPQAPHLHNTCCALAGSSWCCETSDTPGTWAPAPPRCPNRCKSTTHRKRGAADLSTMAWNCGATSAKVHCSASSRCWSCGHAAAAPAPPPATHARFTTTSEVQEAPRGAATGLVQALSGTQPPTGCQGGGRSVTHAAVAGALRRCQVPPCLTHHLARPPRHVACVRLPPSPAPHLANPPQHTCATMRACMAAPPAPVLPTRRPHQCTPAPRCARAWPPGRASPATEPPPARPPPPARSAAPAAAQTPRTHRPAPARAQVAHAARA